MNISLVSQNAKEQKYISNCLRQTRHRALTQCSVAGCLFETFRCFCCSFVVVSGVVFTRCLVSFSCICVSFWYHFEIILGSFWCHFDALGTHWATWGAPGGPPREPSQKSDEKVGSWVLRRPSPGTPSGAQIVYKS